MRIPIGLEMYSVRQDFARDPLGTLKAVAAMGYEGVEFAGAPPVGGALLRAMLDEVGLVCCGWHTGFNMVQDDTLAATITLNKAVGNRRVIIPGFPHKMDTRANWAAMAGFFNALADTLGAHDLLTGYHNHTTEFQPLDGEEPWDTFFSHTDRRVITQLDTGNAMHGGADPVALLHKYPGRAGSVHLKPYTPGAADPFKAPIGEDASDWAGIFHACETLGATDWYVVEYESDAYAPLDAVDKCLQGLKAMGK